MASGKAYNLLLGALLAGGWLSYRKVLSGLMIRNNNLFIKKDELQSLRSEGKVAIDGVEVKLFTYHKHLDPKKQTVIIEADGASGVICASEFSKDGNFNVVLLSREKSLSKTSSGLLPYTQNFFPVYSNMLGFSEFLGYGSRRWAYYYSLLTKKNTASHATLDKALESNRDLNSRFVSEATCRTLHTTIIAEDGTARQQDLIAGNKMLLLKTIVEGLVFKPKPDLIMNNVQIVRSVFSEEDSGRFVGVLTADGMVLGDHYILSTEQSSKQHAEKFGLVLPILQRSYYYTSLEKEMQPEVNLKEQSIVLGDKAMTSRKPAGSSNQVSLEISADRLPLLGRVKETPNCYLNLAYGGNTFALAFAGAECLKNEVQQTRRCDMFEYSRFPFTQ